MGTRPTPREITVERERRSWELRQRGWTVRRIGGELQVAPSTVTRALQRTERRVLAAVVQGALGERVRRTLALVGQVEEGLHSCSASIASVPGGREQLALVRACLRELRALWTAATDEDVQDHRR